MLETAPYFTLQLSRPLPQSGSTTVLDLNPSITALTFSTDIKGGFNGLSVGMRQPWMDPEFYAYLPQPVDIDLFFHVQLLAGSALVWEGRVMKLTRGAGGVIAFEAEGYGVTATDDDFFTASGGGGNTTGTVLKDLIGACAPLITIGGDFLDPGIDHADTEFSQKTPKDAINQLSSEGGGGSVNSIYDFLVYEQRIASFLPRLAPATPQYAVDFEPKTVSWVEDAANAVSTVGVSYTPSGGVPTLTDIYVDQAFINRFGFTRAKLIQGSEMTAAGAPQFAQSYLTLHRGPDISVTITRAGGRGLEVPGGAEVAAYLPRAGEWVQVGDQGPFIITHSEYSANTQTGTYELGVQPPGYLRMIMDLLLANQALARALNPVTGAPMVAG